jgi:hypothetical protein
MIDRRELLTALTVAALATRLPGGFIAGRQAGTVWAAIQLGEKIADVGDVLPVLTWDEAAGGIVMDRGTVTECHRQPCGDWWFELSYSGMGEIVPGPLLGEIATNRFMDPVTRAVRLY